jgi:hypothetical protein
MSHDLFGATFLIFFPEKRMTTKILIAYISTSPNRTMPSLQFVLAVSPDDNHASEDPSTGSRKRKEAPTLEYDDQTQTPPHSPFSPRRLTKEHATFSLTKEHDAKKITPGKSSARVGAVDKNYNK